MATVLYEGGNSSSCGFSTLGLADMLEKTPSMVDWSMRRASRSGLCRPVSRAKNDTLVVRAPLFFLTLTAD